MMKYQGNKETRHFTGSISAFNYYYMVLYMYKLTETHTQTHTNAKFSYCFFWGQDNMLAFLSNKKNQQKYFEFFFTMKTLLLFSLHISKKYKHFLSRYWCLSVFVFIQKQKKNKTKQKLLTISRNNGTELLSKWFCCPLELQKNRINCTPMKLCLKIGEPLQFLLQMCGKFVKLLLSHWRFRIYFVLR